jgi:16S rRNA (uracil1498-N3)-methyltransferase
VGSWAGVGVDISFPPWKSAASGRNQSRNLTQNLPRNKPEFLVSDRFYFEGPLGPGEVTLTGPEAHHSSTVRRLEPGDTITLFNGDGHEYPARIVEIAKKRVTVRVTGVETPDREIGFPLHVASALPKGDRGDFLIEKLTELGVTDFTPLATDRSVVKATDSKADKLRRAVIEASKQCGRNVLMHVHPAAVWRDWCLQQQGRRLIAHPDDGKGRNPHATGGVTIAVGPEGGFTKPEVGRAVEAGWELLSLGPRILRVETAALAAVVLFGSTGES